VNAALGASNHSPRYPANKLSILLTAGAFALWISSLFRTKLVPDEWGIINSLSASYFLALVLLTVASAMLWRSPRNENQLLCLQVSLLIAMLQLTPLLLGGTPVTTRNMFAHRSLTEFIGRYGHIDPASQYYHNWPAFNLLEYFLINITDTASSDLVLILAPFATQFAAMPVLYLFFRNTIGASNQVWAAVWLFYVGNGTGAFSFAPQPLGMLLFLVLMALLTRALPHPTEVSSLWVVAGVAIAGLVMSHLLTSIAGLFAVTALCLSRTFKVRWALALFFGVLIALWTVYVATYYFNIGVQDVVRNRIFRLDRIWFWNVAMYRGNIESAKFLPPIFLKFAFFALVGMIGLSGLAVSWRWRNRAWLSMAYLLAGMIALVPFSFYTGEYFVRLYFYSLPVLAYFGVHLLRTRRAALVFVLLLMLALPLHIISHYGNYARESLSPSVRASLHFLKNSTSRGKVFINEPDFTMGYKSEYEFVSYSKLNPRSIDFVTEDYSQFFPLMIGRPPAWLPFYARIDPILQAEFAATRGNPRYVPQMNVWLDSAPIFALVYSNSDGPVGPFIYVSESR
jgi:hypothetical protein